MNYYTKGKLAAFALDLAIRRNSGGERGLEDVLVALYREGRESRGYEEGRIRELVVELGGSEAGRLYDRWVDTTEDGRLSETVFASGYLLRAGALRVDPEARRDAVAAREGFRRGTLGMGGG